MSRAEVFGLECDRPSVFFLLRCELGRRSGPSRFPLALALDILIRDPIRRTIERGLYRQ